MNIVQNLRKAFEGFKHLAVIQQFAVLIGLSVSVALGMSVLLWVQSPNYRPVFTQLDPKDTGHVIEELHKASIPYKLDEKSGIVLVPSSQYQKARMKLSGLGINDSSGMGFELLDRDQNFGSSRFLENINYRRALEGELARTIASMSGIKTARVHLAIPKQAQFLGQNSEAKATVFVQLASGRQFKSKEASTIAQMVSSSVVGLTMPDVTVVDQYGRVLSAQGDELIAQTRTHYNYKQQLEKNYENRIETILAPLLGLNNVRVRVSAELNFVHNEQTQESYNPDQQVVRSEHTISENQQANATGGGVPGALSNQAPGGGAGAESKSAKGSTREQTTRKYELGKAITYSKRVAGEIKKLSIAVLVNDKAVVDEKTGKVTFEKMKPEEVAQITSIVKNTIGFKAGRGDEINVVNSRFAPPEKIDPMPEIPLWKQSWLWDMVKKFGGIVAGLIIALLIIKPTMNRLATKTVIIETEPSLSKQEEEEIKERKWKSLKRMAHDDPNRVAGVIKNWIEE